LNYAWGCTWLEIWLDHKRAAWSRQAARWGIIEGSIQPILDAETMEAERINALSNLLSDLTGREAELRRYL
jgi:hypothetical protein